ncbi:MAG: NADH-quinone oxidoreductase subunit F [Betaproteobacteria bacterium TMED82]|nr:MAG: NADH-quinone oxidoreductase subunit F [Betaproteobacteria bacterium TMED82]|tara:strand:+ start:40878 stop:42698 length:1821 start_codon:yes stop_codon:yes gene_type:complete
MSEPVGTAETVSIRIADIKRPRKRSKKDQAKAKGLQADKFSIEDIKSLRGIVLDRRDLLIENLHLIQDKYLGLKEKHLVALAKLMNLPMAEVYEVASFYHHFDLLKDHQQPAQVTVRVCDSVSCELAGADDLYEKLNSHTQKNVRIVRVPCVGRCEQAPVAVVYQNPIPFAKYENVASYIEKQKIVHEPAKSGNENYQGLYFNPVDFVEKSLPSFGNDGSVSPRYVGFEEYIANNGYQLAKSFFCGKADFDHAIETMKNSGLRGLGGAGFPVGKKWSIVRDQPGRRLMAVNIDEGEPGTFKDRTYLERDPHRFLEGMLIAAKIVGIESCYIYLRDEYHGCRALLEKEIVKMQQGLDFQIPKIELRRGAGAYICGEESAMIESIEGKRGEPRMRPPYIAQVGLFGLPTLEHNFESLYWVKDILERGAEWFASFGRHGRTGLRSFSVSGRVKSPGVKLAPAGITVQELIDEYCDGMMEGHEFYGYLPGGASGGILPANLNNIPLDFDTLQAHGCFIGSAAVMVFSDKDKASKLALNVMRFFEHESCGQCTPCRVGTAKAHKLMKEISWNADALNDLKTVMTDSSICGLGQAASNPINCVQRYFKDEIK